MKFVFWSIVHQRRNIALTEDLARYARGETFWQAMAELDRISPEFSPAAAPEETPLGERLRMYHDTGLNKVEIMVVPDGERFALQCANSRSRIAADSARDALRRYIAHRAETTVVNRGEADGGP